MVNVPKFMVTVETKNYPVLSTSPIIQRYAKIRKKMNASEIAACLANYASVTLEKNNGTAVKLTANNFKSVLLAYSDELKNIQLNADLKTEEAKNEERLEKIKEEPAVEAAAPKRSTKKSAPVEETPVEEPAKEEAPAEEQNETVQEDPEDEDTFDETPYYETPAETTEAKSGDEAEPVEEPKTSKKKK